MALPKFLTAFLAAYGINAKELEGFLVKTSDKLGLPEAWKDSVGVWLSEHTPLSSEKIIAIVAIVYAELTSPTPGFDSEHGRDA